MNHNIGDSFFMPSYFKSHT